MKFQNILTVGSLLVGNALAHPVSKRADIDPIILQFALTLEHLENVFYKEALAMFSEDMFTAAGLPAGYYSNLKYIAHDEEAHVELLSAGLTAAGAMPVAPCEYSFGMTDVKSFITLSSVLEGVGTSAYLGAAPLVTSKEYLAIAGSILVTEALHTSFQRAAIGEVPMANPYGTALSPNPVYTLAASFIKSCPSTNMALPFMAFPTLTAVTMGMGSPGMPFMFSVAGTLPSTFYVTFVSGLVTMSMAPTMVSGTSFTAMIPATVGGQTYAFVTSENVTMSLMDSMVLYGPAIIEATPMSPTFDPSEA